MKLDDYGVIEDDDYRFSTLKRVLGNEAIMHSSCGCAGYWFQYPKAGLGE